MIIITTKSGIKLRYRGTIDLGFDEDGLITIVADYSSHAPFDEVEWHNLTIDHLFPHDIESIRGE